MSTTIGFGCIVTSHHVLVELEALAKCYGYGLKFGVENSEPDVRSGIEVAQQHEGWTSVLLLEVPRDTGVSLAFSVHQELAKFETTRERPKFFDFIADLASVCRNKCSKLAIFFGSEWCANDHVRFSSGTEKDLISLLSLPGHWCIRYLDPKTWRLQDSDETPLLFDFILHNP